MVVREVALAPAAFFDRYHLVDIEPGKQGRDVPLPYRCGQAAASIKELLVGKLAAPPAPRQIRVHKRRELVPGDPHRRKHGLWNAAQRLGETRGHDQRVHREIPRFGPNRRPRVRPHLREMIDDHQDTAMPEELFE